MTDADLLAEPDPAYRRNVGLMLLNPQGLAWVGRRVGTADAWQMPQGGIDPGETPEQSALRELEEEIGTAKAEILCATPGWLTYDLPPDLAAGLWKGRWRGQAQRWFALRFKGRDSEIRIDGEHPEFDAWRWARLDELPTLAVSFKREIYEVLAGSFARFAEPAK